MSMPSDTPPTERRFVVEESGSEMAWLMNNDRMVTQAMGGLFPEGTDVAAMQDVLDIACGPGLWTVDVAQAYPETQVVGFDCSEPMIQYAGAHARSRGIQNVTFEVMNALHPLDFPGESFDLVNARGIFGFMSPETWPALLQECKRILRKNGVMRLTELETPYSNTPAHARLWDAFAQALYVTGRSYSPHGHNIGIVTVMSGLLRDAGFAQVRQKAHVADFSAGTKAFEGWYQSNKMTFPLLEPFIVQSGVISKEEYEQTYQQMVAEMLSNDFCGAVFLLTALGNKP
jgi:ubiquinone/menaquinone biosynthesis C-methylase UbiE